MAFYPDELSPIDRVRNLGKPPELPDINPVKNRRQWKSIVLGKKDMGMNNFATITEEKEEEISSDGSQGANSNKGDPISTTLQGAVVANKKITFPKPRKYITSRVTERKEDGSSEELDALASRAASLESPPKEPSRDAIDPIKNGVGSSSNLFASSKSKVSEPRWPLKAKKSRELVVSAQELVENYALSESPAGAQWNEAISEAVFLKGWCRADMENEEPSKFEPSQKWKQEEKKKSPGSSKASATADSPKREPKTGKKKFNASTKSGKTGEGSSAGQPQKEGLSKGKAKAEKGKTLNMKDVVNVYKNLAYGSKEEIKSFVEKLSFVKDESKTENDKNLLSVMNLKALENKIKNFTKKSVKGQGTSITQEKKTKTKKPARKNRKAHIDRLARHKVIKVPAMLNNSRSRGNAEGTSGKVSEKGKATPVKDKEPWKYVGMQSILDKTYFVYPAYPPSVGLNKGGKSKKDGAKGGENKRSGTVVKSKGVPGDATKATDPEPKVKAPQVVLRQSLFTEGNRREKIPSGTTRSTSVLNFSASNKSINRSSATTVCTVEFRPAVGQKSSPSAEPRFTDPGLLVYLHGTKAINVKSPYSDKQFSRVKLFRKDERGVPLIKGLGRRSLPKRSRGVSVRKIILPEKFDRVRSLDVLDFDEDIQNITDFLRSQNSPSGRPQGEREGLKKSERWAKNEPREDSATNRQRRQRRSAHQSHHKHHHQHGTPRDTPSSDFIIHEISKHIQHLQYLPDTEDNREMIARFFDELDRRIEASRSGPLTLPEIPPFSPSFRPIPILGY